MYVCMYVCLLVYIYEDVLNIIVSFQDLFKSAMGLGLAASHYSEATKKVYIQ